MPYQIYLDESVRSSYLVVSALIENKKVREIRKSVKNFARFNRKNLHMFHASTGFKLRVLNEVLSYDLEVVIVEDLKFKFRKSLSRQICLRSAFEFASTRNIDRIVLDRSNSQEKDLITYKKSSRKFPTLPENLHHIASRQEPLLWLPDIFAWSYGAGGLWREKIDHKISHIIRV
jgi:Protein of unknown function (DUF3800)